MATLVSAHLEPGYYSTVNTLALVLMIIAAVLFAIEAVRGRSLVAGGLCAMALAFAIPGLAALG